MEKIGATGKFPYGKINEDDEGQLATAVYINREKKVVILDFGKLVSWIAMTADEADGFADLLKAKVAELRK